MRLTILIMSLLGLIVPALAAVKVVTTTTDLAAITREVGGSRVQVESLARGDQDLHRVEPRPSFVARLTRAKMIVRVGMDLDTWMDALLQAARNGDIGKGGKGYVDASAGIKPLEVPSGKVDGSKGDIHIYGNPHYWLDPENGKIIARNILAGLKRVDPEGAAVYQQNYDRFVKRIDERMEAWNKRMAPLRGTKVVQYHTTFNYFLHRFGISVAGMLETKPGIPPSAAHVSELIADMKRDKVRIVMTTGYYPARFTDLVRRETGAAVLVLPSSIGGSKAATDYFTLFDTIVEQMRAAK
ncbi:MAG: metal ABC transporter substrate-binding protein [Armatimonadota bacterium]